MPLEVAVCSTDAFRYREVAAEARRMRRLGMSLRAIGRALGVDDKTVAKALNHLSNPHPRDCSHAT